MAFWMRSGGRLASHFPREITRNSDEAAVSFMVFRFLLRCAEQIKLDQIRSELLVPVEQRTGRREHSLLRNHAPRASLVSILLRVKSIKIIRIPTFPQFIELRLAGGQRQEFVARCDFNFVSFRGRVVKSREISDESARGPDVPPQRIETKNISHNGRVLRAAQEDLAGEVL